MNVYENMTLSQMENYSTNGVLNVSKEKDLARDWIKRLGIKTPSEYKDCAGLSGGNQQKVVLAKWRSGGSDIMLMDHPTRGLDIGAKEDVYDMIREMSDARRGYHSGGRHAWKRPSASSHTDHRSEGRRSAESGSMAYAVVQTRRSTTLSTT